MPQPADAAAVRPGVLNGSEIFDRYPRYGPKRMEFLGFKEQNEYNSSYRGQEKIDSINRRA